MVTLIGIPFDGKSSFMKGTALAPERIRQEFRSSAYNAFAESLKDVYALVTDGGDITGDTFDQLRMAIGDRYLDPHPCLFLGGDHSISYLTVKKMHTLLGKNVPHSAFRRACGSL